MIYRGVEQLAARRAHNPEAAGSSPAAATIKDLKSRDFRSFLSLLAGKSRTQKVGQRFDPSADPYGSENRLLLRFGLRFAKINLFDKSLLYKEN